MANDKFRGASAFINKKKFAECSGSNLDLAANREAQFGDHKILGYSSGPKTSTAKLESMTPVKGMSVKAILEDAYKNDTPIELVFGVINGGLISGEFVIQNIGFVSDNKAGTVSCSVDIEGGEVDFG